MPWYIPNTWNVGDKISKAKLDRLEQGLADADVSNPSSPAAASLSTTYVSFADQNGNPISAEKVRIIVDTTVTPNQISDIVVVTT